MNEPCVVPAGLRCSEVVPHRALPALGMASRSSPQPGPCWWGAKPTAEVSDPSRPVPPPPPLTPSASPVKTAPEFPEETGFFFHWKIQAVSLSPTCLDKALERRTLGGWPAHAAVPVPGAVSLHGTEHPPCPQGGGSPACRAPALPSRWQEHGMRQRLSCAPSQSLALPSPGLRS